MNVLRCTFYAVRGLVAAFVLMPVCWGEAKNTEAMDVTVRLFSTGPVQSVKLSGGGARLRLCAACAVQALSSPLKVIAADGGRVSVDGRVVAGVFVDGEVKASTADGRTAQVAGRWRVLAARDGLHVTVGVPSERYVMAVLQAEASADEPRESLKALAVVVRSFAMQNPQRHGLEGLCDSTHCQALRLGPVKAQVREAVEATAGETLWFGPASGVRRVGAYFTQDCGGMTEDAAALWSGERKPWLGAHPDPFCARQPALWHAELSVAQVRDALRAEGLGVPDRIRSVAVSKMDGGGRASEVMVTGGRGQEGNSPGLKPLCSGQSNQGPEGPCSLPVTTRSLTSAAERVDGSMRVKAATLRFALNRAYGWNELRSDWYRVSVVNGRVVFDGRGYGHGVGLCQAGAREMAGLGKGYREILGFYFPGTSVRVLAGDAGWAVRPGKGWMLRAVRSGNEWVRAGDAAWAKARSVFPVARDVRPSVTVYPTTELFREGTGEPGWELAATRGVAVAVQPEAVVAQASTHRAKSTRDEWGTRDASDASRMESLLLHEFLHVLVESEAGAAAPLWLREGLVEALAGERCVAVQMSLAETEKGLAGAGSLAESQRAHAAACALAREAVQRYGITAVRSWLRDGVPAGVGGGLTE